MTKYKFIIEKGIILDSRFKCTFDSKYIRIISTNNKAECIKSFTDYFAKDGKIVYKTENELILRTKGNYAVRIITEELTLPNIKIS